MDKSRRKSRGGNANKSVRGRKTRSSTPIDNDTMEQSNAPNLTEYANFRAANNDVVPAKKFYDIRTALNTVPIYDGGILTLNNFVACCKSASDFVEPDDRPMLLRSLQSKCIGDALDFVQISEPSNSIEEFVSKIREHFGKSINENQLSSELALLKQNSNESLQEYAKRAELILNKISIFYIANYDASTAKLLSKSADNRAATQFLIGLKEDKLANAVRPSRPEKLAEAINLAKTTESEIDWREKLHGQPREVAVASITADGGGRAFGGWHGGRGGYHARGGGGGRDGQWRGSRNYGERSAQNDNQGNNEPRFEGKCFYCNKSGHKRDDCRKRKYDESYKNTENKSAAQNNQGANQGGAEKRQRNTFIVSP